MRFSRPRVLSASLVATFAIASFACGGDDAGTSGTGETAGADASTPPAKDSGTTPQQDASVDAPGPVKEYAVGGTIVGLKGSGLALKLNGGADVAVSGSAFTFSTKIASGQPYQVTVGAQPKTPAQTCTVQNGSGTIGSADVTNVTVTCVDDKFPVNVNVTGLVAGTTLVLQNNAGDDLSVTMPGTVAFSTALVDGAAYLVSVKTQPTAPAQTCEVTGTAGGTIAGAAATVNVACTKDWANSREIAVTSDLASAAANHQVLVVLDAGFSYAKAQANGADLRFSSTAAFADSLAYFIESWNPGGVSYVWVKVPTVPVGASTIHMHYGRATAAAASDFATTFPTAQITAGAGAGDFAANADIDVDWFELEAGDTMTLEAGVARVVNARRIIIGGTVEGTGRGYASPPNNTAGNGPGGGGTSNTAGAGGGAYGGAGGLAGHDSGDSPGAGGAVYGTETGTDIAPGSSAGSTDNGIGGAGGGALTLRGSFVSVPGTVKLDGTAGTTGSRCGGGGAGGGLLALGIRLDFTGGTVTAIGGAGGLGDSTFNDSGGGGGGGRLKFLARSFYAAPATASVDFGLGGPNGDIKAENGNVGTTYGTDAAAAADVPAVRATVGAEN